MHPHPISLDRARELAVEGALLAGPRPTADAEGILAVVRRLTQLQIDPTRTVEKTHLLVLWSRLGDFQRSELDRLLWQERQLFEYRAFIVPAERLPEIRFLMANFASGKGAWAARVREWMAANRAFRTSIDSQLRAEGPLLSRAIDATALASDWKSSGWTHTRNVTQMLEFMAACGEVAVAGRRGNERLWDVPERVLPLSANEKLSATEFCRRRTLAAVRRLGVATTQEIVERAWPVPRHEALAVIEELAEAGDLVPVTYRTVDAGAVAAWTHGGFEQIARTSRSRTSLLSPFDLLIKDRERTEALFGFRYRLEMYVPRARREFGHFVLPVLRGRTLIGRVAPVMDRRAGVLRIEGIFLEPGAAGAAGNEDAIRATVDDLARFLGADAMVYEPPA